MAEVVVIGAGLGGLAAAVELSAAGHTVRVVEALDRVGGKAGVETVDDPPLETVDITAVDMGCDDVLSEPQRRWQLLRDEFLSFDERRNVVRPDTVDDYDYPVCGCVSPPAIENPRAALRGAGASVWNLLSPPAAPDAARPTLGQRARSMWGLRMSPPATSDANAARPALRPRPSLWNMFSRCEER